MTMGSHKDSSRGQRRAKERRDGIQQDQPQGPTPGTENLPAQGPPPHLVAWPDAIQLSPAKLDTGDVGVILSVTCHGLVIQLPLPVEQARILFERGPDVCDMAERLAAQEASGLWTPDQGAAPNPETIIQAQDHLKNGGNPT